MKRRRRCRHCRDLFLPDPRCYRPSSGNPQVRTSPQRFCSKPECRRESRRRSHRAHRRRNPRYRVKQLGSARRWRKKNEAYWRRRRRERPKVAERNRALQRQRDAKAKGDLANINTIGAVWREKLARIDTLIDLANINPSQVPQAAVSEEIVAFLRGWSRLANINAIGKDGGPSAQSPS